MPIVYFYFKARIKLIIRRNPGYISLNLKPNFNLRETQDKIICIPMHKRENFQLKIWAKNDKFAARFS